MFYAVALLVSVDDPVQAETISLQSVLNEATSTSFDIQISRLRAQQLHSDIRAARADYYPTLSAAASSEYDKGLKKAGQQVFSVANSTYNAGTRFQEVASLQSYWTLFDFGTRANTLNAARRMYESASISTSATVRDLRLSIIDVYSQALTTYKALRAKEQTIPAYHELFDIKNRTYQAGNISRVELGEQSLQLAQAQDSVQVLRQTLTEQLKQLTAFTHKTYPLDQVAMLDFDESRISQVLAFERKKTPDYLLYQKQIDAKKSEMNALLAQRLPQVKAYGSYVFYGTNANSLGSAIQGFSHRMADIGVTVQWTAFDGFKNAAARERKKYEIQELEVQRDKKLWELQNQYDTANATLAPMAAQMTTKAEIIKGGEAKIAMYQRLSDRKITDRTSLLNQKVQLIDQQLAAQKLRIQKSAAVEKLKILAGG